MLVLGLTCMGGAQAQDAYDLVQTSWGLDFLHAGDPTLNATYPEIMGSGACVLDYDGDGWEDLFLVNSRYWNATTQARMDPRSALFRNLEGDGFARVPGALEISAWGMGCAIGDYDADGDPDVALNTWGGPQLWRNDGGAVFVDVTDAAGIRHETCSGFPCFGSSLAWLDIENDADLDLYVTNYVLWDMVGPSAPVLYEGACNILFRNEGNSTFTDVTDVAGVADCGRAHLGLAIADYTGDGFQDIYVASDETPNAMLVNLGNGTFVDRAVEWGVADTRGGMGVAAGDYDGDGWHDLVITHYETEGFALYRRNATSGFDDTAVAAGFHDPTLPFVGWGTEWVDLDMDGDLDVVAVNGHIPGLVDNHTELFEQDLVFRNEGNGRLTDISETAWNPTRVGAVSRGLATADFDQDGYLDFVIMDNANETVRAYRSAGGANNWLQIEVDGTGAGTREALGAIIEVDVDSRTMRREVVAQASYQSQSTRLLHFGLGSAVEADAVRVRFVEGTVLELGALSANQRVQVDASGALTLLRARPLADAPARVDALRGEPVVLEASVLRAAPGAESYFLVDGQKHAGTRVEHAFHALGEHEVLFVVQEPDGAQDQVAIVVAVASAPPTAAGVVPSAADRLAPTVFDGTSSSDPDGSIVAWTWNVEGLTLHGARVEHTFRSIGDVRVELRVEDDTGGTDSASFLVHVANAAPVASPGGDRPSNPRATLVFEDHGSHDPDGEVVAWTWTFGNGATATGRQATYQYTTFGTYTAALTVTDNDGAQGTTTFLVHVTDDNLPPRAAFAASTMGDRATAHAFDASATRDDDGTLASFVWHFGDGATAEGRETTHRFRTLGDHTVRLLVTDDEGATAEATLTVTVVNLPPRITPLPAPLLHEGLGPLTVGPESEDLDGRVVSWRWDWGDGSTSEDEIGTHSYATYGRYTLTIKAEDDDGAVARVTTEVWVHERPRAVASVPVRADRVAPVTLDASGSGDADGTVVAWTWRFADGTSRTGAVVEHVFATAGVQTVELVVVDNDGFSDRALFHIDVENHAPMLDVVGPLRVNVGRDAAFSAAGTDRDGPTPDIRWTLDGVEVGQGSTITLQFSAPGTHVLEVVAQDADGATSRTERQIEATSLLHAAVTMSKGSYALTEVPSGRVEVRFADGAPAAGAAVTVEVTYRARLADRGFALVTKDVTGTTDASGTFAFRVEEMWPDEARPYLPRVRPPSDACATYEVAAQAEFAPNHGEATTRFSVTAHEQQRCDKILPDDIGRATLLKLPQIQDLRKR